MTEISNISGTTAYVLPPGTTYEDAIDDLKAQWNALNSSLQPTNAKLQAISDAVAYLQAHASDEPPPSVSALQAAMTALGSFDLNAYYASLSALKAKATVLINAEAARQHADDDLSLQTIYDIETLKLSLNDSDPITDEQLSNAINQYETDRSILNQALNDYRNSCYQAALERIDLQTLSTSYYLSCATAILQHPTDSSQWPVTKPSNLLQQISDTQAAVNTRDGQRFSAVTNALSSLNTHNNRTSPPGLLTCLDSLKTTRQAAANPLIAAINQVVTNVQTYITTQQALDAAAQTQHFIDYPSTSSLTPDQLAAINAKYNDLLNENLTQVVNAILAGIDLPTLKGGMISMADIMRIIGQNALIVQRTLHYARISDANLNILRATILALIMSKSAETTLVFEAYNKLLREADIAYNREDLNRYNAAIDELNTLKDNLSAINALLAQAQSSTIITISNTLNSIGAQIAQTLNDASSAQPDAINYFDLLNLDPNATIPTPLPIPATPGAATVPMESIQLDDIIDPPRPPASISKPMPSLTNFNDAITKINEALTFIQPQLQAAGITFSETSTNPYLLTPLVYRALIDVRSNQDVTISDKISVQNLVAAVINMMSQTSTNTAAKFLEDSAAAFFVHKMTGESTQSVPTTEGSGAMTTTDIDVVPSALTRVMIDALQSAEFRLLVQQFLSSSTLNIGSQLGIQPQESYAGYSTFGIVSEENIKSLTTDQINQFISNLQQLSSQLTALAQKSDILAQLAAALIAIQKENLSTEDTNILLKRLMQAAQIISLTLATVSLVSSASVGAKGAITIPEFNIAIDSKKALDMFERLFKPEAGPSITTTEDMKKAVSSFIAQLNINLTALDEKTRSKIVQTILDNMQEAIYQFLTEEEKMKLATAIATDQMNKEAVREFAIVLSQIADNKVSSASIQKLYQLLSSPDEKLFPIFSQIKDSIKSISLDKKDADRIERLVAAFAETIITQKDFYQFAIDFLLDPAKSFVKSFSLISREAEKPGTQPISRIMGA